jgi:hypothetical protein
LSVGIASLLDTGPARLQMLTRARIQLLVPAREAESLSRSRSIQTKASRSGSGPRVVALRFLSTWLRCVYSQRPCSRIAGALRAYTSALARETHGWLATPAERAARLRVVAIRLIWSCRPAAVAAAWYRDGTGGRFEVHVNLVHEAAGWEVFDVAETAPHIAQPAPIADNSRGC